MEEVLKNPGMPICSVFRTQHKAGHYIWLSTIITNLLQDKSVQAIVMNFEDITLRKRTEETLKKTIREVSDYKYALDQSSIVAVTDQKGIIKYVNENFCRISKYSKEELIGQDHRIINSGHHSKEFINIIWTTIAKGKVWKGEIKNRAKDGTYYWVDTTIIPFLDENRRPFQYVAIRSDITERKDVEEKQTRNYKEIKDYKDALDESSIVAITDQRGIINYVNENFCKISKYSREELIGQDHRIINSGHHTKEFIKAIWTTIANGKVWKGDIKNRAKDGTYYWVDTTIVPFLGENNKPFQYLAIRADITDRKKTEENLLQSLKETQNYKTTLDESSIVATTNQKGIIKFANDNFCKISKYSKEELIGQDHRIINSGYHSKEFIESIWTTIANGKVWKGEIKNKAKDGTYYWVDTTIVPFLDENKKPYQYLAIHTDITGRKKTETEILGLNEELERKVQDRTQQLQVANKEMESFSYSVAHDLRSPVRAMHGYATILEEDYSTHLDEEGRRLVFEIEYNAKKMGALIDDLLTFSRLGRKEINRSYINMNELVDSSLKEINSTLKSLPKINIHKLHSVIADSALITHVMTNLLSNAIKYSSKTPNPVIEITSKQDNENLVFSVRDNGVGFDMEYADKLFGVFQRLHSDEEFEGTGVGLAIVQSIIHKHGGKVWAEGKEGEGATFNFSLPARATDKPLEKINHIIELN